MGTEVYHKSYLPGYYSMRDTNEDSNSSSWPLFYGDKALTNGHYYNGFVPRTITDTYTGYDKDALKNKMLEHEAIFKSQVYELHRLYGRQRDMMEEVRRKELHKHRISIDTSSSSSLLPSQMPSEDARKWQMPSFPLVNNNSGRPSLFGAEIIDSPLSCTKGSSSKDCEVLECRPLKVRKKLFDLQLPADEYIDDNEEGEQVQENKTSEASSYPSNGNNGIIPKKCVNLFNNSGGRKADCFGDASSGQCLRGSSGLADLNEPIHVEEANVPTASVDFLGLSACGGEFRGPDLSAKPTSKFLGFSHEHFQKSQNGINKGAFNNLSVEHKSNGREWLSYVREAGNSKSDMNFTSQFLQPEKLPTPSFPMQHTHGKDQRTSGNFPIETVKVDSWRERVGGSSEVLEKFLDHSHYNHPVPALPSYMSSSYPFVNSSDMANTWSHSIASWGKPSSSLTQKLPPAQPYQSYISSGTMCRSSLTSPQSHDIFGDKWFANSSSRSHIGSASDIPTANGFYHGSSSGSREPSARVPSLFDSLNLNRGDNVGTEQFYSHGSQKLFKGSDCMDSRSVKDMNLNLNAVQSSSNEEVPHQGLGVTDDKKCDGHEALPPWLRAKAVSKKDSLKNPLLQTETRNVSSVSSDHVVGAKERDDCPGNRKLLGFPIFGNPSLSKNDSSSLVSTSASLRCPPDGENMQKEMKHRAFDINVALDSTFETDKQIDAEALVEEKEMDTKANSFRNQFDLNSCLTEDEDLITQSVKSTSAKVNRVEIDLEVPADPEDPILCGADHYEQPQAPLQLPQQKPENLEVEELAKVAAEAIVALSISDQQSVLGSTSEEVVTIDDPLMWFVEVVSTCVDNFDRKSENSSSDEIDDFEAMTLQLEETKEDDYMPVPFVPEIQEPEEAGPSSLPTRPRRGQARRGRPRRDFQRDILPGLTSLSRHEVTEDLQIFGGLMRATGHAWNSGLTRRNGGRGGGRGRRKTVVVDPPPPPPPLVEQINNIEVALEERSLTAGWAKTPRRPRRQRCAAGNSVAVPLT